MRRREFEKISFGLPQKVRLGRDSLCRCGKGRRRVGLSLTQRGRRVQRVLESRRNCGSFPNHTRAHECFIVHCAQCKVHSAQFSKSYANPSQTKPGVKGAVRRLPNKPETAGPLLKTPTCARTCNLLEGKIAKNCQFCLGENVMRCCLYHKPFSLSNFSQLSQDR